VVCHVWTIVNGFWPAAATKCIPEYFEALEIDRMYADYTLISILLSKREEPIITQNSLFHAKLTCDIT
jgi:hypothetical protein